MTGSGALAEIQGTAERHPFTQEGLLQTLTLARHGIEQLIVAQRTALGVPPSVLPPLGGEACQDIDNTLFYT